MLANKLVVAVVKFINDLRQLNFFASAERAKVEFSPARVSCDLLAHCRRGELVLMLGQGHNLAEVEERLCSFAGDCTVLMVTFDVKIQSGVIAKHLVFQGKIDALLNLKFGIDLLFDSIGKQTCPLAELDEILEAPLSFNAIPVKVFLGYKLNLEVGQRVVVNQADFTVKFALIDLIDLESNSTHGDSAVADTLARGTREGLDNRRFELFDVVN